MPFINRKLCHCDATITFEWPLFVSSLFYFFFDIDKTFSSSRSLIIEHRQKFSQLIDYKSVTRRIFWHIITINYKNFSLQSSKYWCLFYLPFDFLSLNWLFPRRCNNQFIYIVLLLLFLCWLIYITTKYLFLFSFGEKIEIKMSLWENVGGICNKNLSKLFKKHN